MVTNAPKVDQVWTWLAEIEDPEIPAISIVDLGIVRDVSMDSDGCVVTITPTYSGCPATQVIAQSVVDRLRRQGVEQVRIETSISPPWTTDWMSESGKRKLSAYGIAPPHGPAAEALIPVHAIGRGGFPLPTGLRCPNCDATDVQLTSQFGSTPCKALYRCKACLEPFDHFKCH